MCGDHPRGEDQYAMIKFDKFSDEDCRFVLILSTAKIGNENRKGVKFPVFVQKRRLLQLPDPVIQANSFD